MLKNTENIALRSSQIFLLLCYVRKPFFEPKVATISARNTIMRKFVNFVRLYFPHITTFFWNVTAFKRFFPGICFFLDQN